MQSRPDDMTSILAPRQPVTTKSGYAFRSPKRITITLPYDAYQRLQERCDREGRSLSNLAAFLLENALVERCLADS